VVVKILFDAENDLLESNLEVNVNGPFFDEVFEGLRRQKADFEIVVVEGGAFGLEFVEEVE